MPLGRNDALAREAAANLPTTRARQNLARSYLRQRKYGIKEIAFLLGFSDAATFTHPFRRWTGQSPGAVLRRSGTPG
jgi:AraC-like DNA-binding protein